MGEEIRSSRHHQTGGTIKTSQFNQNALDTRQYNDHLLPYTLIEPRPTPIRSNRHNGYLSHGKLNIQRMVTFTAIVRQALRADWVDRPGQITFLPNPPSISPYSMCWVDWTTDVYGHLRYHRFHALQARRRESSTTRQTSPDRSEAAILQQRFSGCWRSLRCTLHRVPNYSQLDVYGHYMNGYLLWDDYIHPGIMRLQTSYMVYIGTVIPV
jgi:hypothetical protein